MGTTSAISCDVIRGDLFRPYFGLPLAPDELEDIVRSLAPSHAEVGRRWDEEEQVFCVDWRHGRISYTAGLYKGELTFVNIGLTGVHAMDAAPIPVARAIECLGAPSQVQAWYDAYPYLGFASLHCALAFIPQRAIAFAVRNYSSAPEASPALDSSLPLSLIAIFGEQWAREQRVFAKSEPWPGDWAAVQVQVSA